MFLLSLIHSFWSFFSEYSKPERSLFNNRNRISITLFWYSYGQFPRKFSFRTMTITMAMTMTIYIYIYDYIERNAFLVFAIDPVLFTDVLSTQNCASSSSSYSSTTTVSSTYFVSTVFPRLLIQDLLKLKI